MQYTETVHPFGNDPIEAKQISISRVKYLVMSSRTSYFTPGGKARIARKIAYHVYVIDATTGETVKGLYNFTSKAKAKSAFRNMGGN